MDEKLIHLPTDLPPGFRFHPSDEELIVYYLRNKVQSRPLPASIISDIDLYTYNPWDLPSKFFQTLTFGNLPSFSMFAIAKDFEMF